ncbi:MAG TPA: hypothetical protein VH721_06805 [Gaiellaceae bacterium]
MTDRVARLYAAVGAVLVFFLAWAGIAARPWPQSPDPRLAELAQREQRLQRDAKLVQQVVDRRRADRAAAARARATAATPPPVRIVTLPPVATTRSS